MNGNTVIQMNKSFRKKVSTLEDLASFWHQLLQVQYGQWRRGREVSQ